MSKKAKISFHVSADAVRTAKYWGQAFEVVLQNSINVLEHKVSGGEFKTQDEERPALDVKLRIEPDGSFSGTVSLAE